MSHGPGVDAPRAPGERWRRDAALTFAVALVVRLAMVVWGASRFGPAADGVYYHRIATRVAAGHGYTWLWEDGAVTYAAHYPVGYPGVVGGLYAIFGDRPGAAMTLNAVLGALGALAVHRLVAHVAGATRGAALAGGLLVALHPGLVAYTPALMTEGVTAALLALVVWSVAAAREQQVAHEAALADGAAAAGVRRGAVVLVAVSGILLGMATMVRPQSILLAPLLGALAVAPARVARGIRVHRIRQLVAAVLVTALALVVCAPWTARNCARMGRCALVSVNGGWNLLIGADAGSTGAWSPVQVPEGCREVWDEAGKDTCFGAAARRYIVDHPGAWLALVPRKLAATFDYCGAAGWYLHESNPAAFPARAKLTLGGVETLYERVTLMLALAWLSGVRRARWPWRAAPATIRWRRAAWLALTVVGIAAACTRHGWIAHVVCAFAGALAPWAIDPAGPEGTWPGRPVLASATVVILAVTLVTHAVFFGAGRYSLVVMPFLCGAAGLALARRRPTPVQVEPAIQRTDFDRSPARPAS